MDNLENIGEPEKDTQTTSSEPEEVQKEEKLEDEKISKKEEQLNNLNKAIQEAEAHLRKKRAKPQPKQEEEEESIQIDDSDPSSRAWNKRISESLAPVQSEIEQAKSERRVFALRQFLQDKPTLAKNAEKISRLMDTYEKIKSSSELTSEGILTDIARAYYADNHQDILATEDSREIERAKAESIASDIGVSKGSTTYTPQREAFVPLSDEDKAILAKWNFPEEEFKALKKKYT